MGIWMFKFILSFCHVGSILVAVYHNCIIRLLLAVNTCITFLIIWHNFCLLIICIWIHGDAYFPFCFWFLWHLQIMRDPETGNSRGFGFISYDSFEASDAAIEVSFSIWCSLILVLTPGLCWFHDQTLYKQLKSI